MLAMYWLLIGGSLLTMGDIVFKDWLTRALPYASFEYAAGFALYIAGLFCLVESFKTQHIAIASVVFILVNIITLALVSWLYFGEKLTPVQVIACLLAFTAIVIFHFSE